MTAPDPAKYMPAKYMPAKYMYVRTEAVLSSRIEGTQSTLTDLLRFETQAQDTRDAPVGPARPSVSAAGTAAPIDAALGNPLVHRGGSNIMLRRSAAVYQSFSRTAFRRKS